MGLAMMVSFSIINKHELVLIFMVIMKNMKVRGRMDILKGLGHTIILMEVDTLEIGWAV